MGLRMVPSLGQRVLTRLNFTRFESIPCVAGKKYLQEYLLNGDRGAMTTPRFFGIIQRRCVGVPCIIEQGTKILPITEF